MRFFRGLIKEGNGSGQVLCGFVAVRHYFVFASHLFKIFLEAYEIKRFIFMFRLNGRCVKFCKGSSMM